VKYTTGTPPVGALVFWNKDSYNPYGHVALSIGAWRTISTSEREHSGGATTIHVMSILERNQTKPYLGYMKMPP
jgi:surface antigen